MSILLQFQKVNLSRSHYDSALTQVNIDLHEGELITVLAERQKRRLPLLDAAAGTVEPKEGAICYDGKNWEDYSSREADFARSQIGRSFLESAWLSNLDMDENATLRERHFTRREEKDIYAEARQWAERFEIELPTERPPRIARDTAQRLQWVRAFLGKPRLLLLEYPFIDVSAKHWPLLQQAVEEFIAAGGAALWFTIHHDLWHHSPTRYQLQDEQFKKVSE